MQHSKFSTLEANGIHSLAVAIPDCSSKGYPRLGFLRRRPRLDFPRTNIHTTPTAIDVLAIYWSDEEKRGSSLSILLRS